MTNTQRTTKSAKSTTGTVTADKTYDGFTEEERGAMKERAKELKASSRRGSRTAKADGDSEVRAKIAEMPEADRALAERIHDIVKTSAPDLAPKLWYGMPAYARDGKVVCFFQSAQKFKSRYATLGFSDLAKLDDGTMWPSAYALTELSADDEARIGELVKRAAG
ncbi:iron chaperone [Streptomyces sp. NPDC056656]|uniref:iron chaperone n=1 Tax=Streptomyces sp. NPDC056656 TaxID=3345895 RepID=UPI0036B6E16E